MSQEDDRRPDFSKLSLVRLVAVSDAVLAFGISYWLMTGFEGFDWVVAVICLAIAAFVYGGVFYFGCLIFAPRLKDYIVSDDTEIKGQTVEMVTMTRPAGDAETDRWVASFVFARNLFGMAIVPILLLGGLYFFG